MSVLPYTQFSTPPEIIDYHASWGYQNAYLYFGWPKLRSTTLYNTSFWTNTNMGSYNGALVNDGLTVSTAFTLTTAGDGNVEIDFGSATQVREWYVWYNTFVNGLQFEYSDNNSTWTLAPTEIQGLNQPTIYYIGESIGAHRYWRARKKVAASSADAIAELWPRTYTDLYGAVEAFRVYGGVTQALMHEMKYAPSLATPLLLPVTPSVATHGTSLIVTVVSKDFQVESPGVFFGANTSVYDNTSLFYDSCQENAITVVNGLNSNVAINANSFPGFGPGQIEVSGPTIGFSIGGFSPTPSFGGTRLRLIYRGTQAMTIVNEDVSSTAANRINLTTGANLVLAAGKAVVEFIYNSGSGRWWVKSARDSAGPK